MGVTETRVLTGSALAIGIVAAVLLLPAAGFAVLLWLILILAAWEWGTLLGLSRPVGRLIYLLLLSAVAGAFWLARGLDGIVWLAVGPALVFWLLAAAATGRYRGSGIPRLPALAWELGGFVVLVPAVVAMMALHAVGPLWALYLLLLVAAADTAAFFAGRRWGRTRLAPGISPGKTVAGLGAAIAAGTAFAMVAAPVLGVSPRLWLLWILITVLCVLFSVVGDLMESTLKRQHDAKDSGGLLPGHGGVLDRIDSVTAAAPAFVALLGLAGIGPPGA